MGISHSALNRGRRVAEADMRDTCTARRKDGTVWSESAGKDVPNMVAVYADKCEVKWSEQVILTMTGLTVEGYVLKVPVSAPALAIGDVVTIDSAFADPQLAGRVFGVLKLAAGSHIISRRYQVKEVTGPGG